jgi:CRISPR-associated protein Csb2
MNTIAGAAASITHLGWGVDMVTARARPISEERADELPGRRWKVSNENGTPLRVPTAQTLDALVARHSAVLKSVSGGGITVVPPLRPLSYQMASYDSADRGARRRTAAFDLVPVDPDDRRPRACFPQERAVSIAAMLRHTACEAAKADLGEWRTEEWAEQWVAGHGPHKSAESFPRLSYLPIPTLDYSDGRILRAIIAETPGGDGHSAGWAARRLDGLPLRDTESGKATAILKHVVPGARDVFTPYISESDRWQSITPVILPGFDDNNRGKRIRLLLKCFEQAGIPHDLIADLDVQKSPWSRASAQTGAYRRSKRLEHLPACHVRLYFKHPVPGPLAIGAGRHRGLGLFAAAE